MSDAIDPAFVARARVIARAFARTAEHHRRTALIAGVIALGGCVLAFVAGRPSAKGAALFIAVVFAVFCYRATRTANAYIDPGASPVLSAITSAPAQIVSIVFESARSVVKIATEDACLEVRIDDATPAEPLLDALGDHAPDATVSRE